MVGLSGEMKAQDTGYTGVSLSLSLIAAWLYNPGLVHRVL